MGAEWLVFSAFKFWLYEPKIVFSKECCYGYWKRYLWWPQQFLHLIDNIEGIIDDIFSGSSYFSSLHWWIRAVWKRSRHWTDVRLVGSYLELALKYYAFLTDIRKAIVIATTIENRIAIFLLLCHVDSVARCYSQPFSSKNSKIYCFSDREGDYRAAKMEVRIQ